MKPQVADFCLSLQLLPKDRILELGLCSMHLRSCSIKLGKINVKALLVKTLF